jgi:hypothetical protein
VSETAIYGAFERLCAERQIPAVVLRTNAGERVLVDPATGQRHRIRFMPKGFPDYQCLFPNGRVLFIEFKTEQGKMKVAQLLWRSRLEKLGFGHVIARSAEQGATAAADFYARAREG